MLFSFLFLPLVVWHRYLALHSPSVYLHPVLCISPCIFIVDYDLLDTFYLPQMFARSGGGEYAVESAAQGLRGEAEMVARERMKLVSWDERAD